MSGRLVGEVVDWLRTPVAADLTPNERFVLMLIAERAHEKTREMWRHKIDDETLAERIAGSIGVTQKALGDVLARLGARGLEVRVPIGTDKKGRTVFATRGKATAFRLPELPASMALPTGKWSGQDRTIPESEPVDNPPPEPPEDTPEDEEWSGVDRTIPPNGPDRTGPYGANGPDRTGPYPYKDLPSKDDPSSPVVPSSVAAVEDAPPPAEIFEDQKFDQGEYRRAQEHLLSLPDFGASLIDRIAAAHPKARREVCVIHAARHAMNGAHA